MLYAFNAGNSMAERYVPLTSAAMKIKLEATTAHLWFEEIMSGDRFVDIEDVWGHLDQAQWYAHAMLEGGETPEETFVPLENPALRRQVEQTLENISAFRAIAQQRWNTRSQSAIGSDIELRFDSVFEDLFVSADSVETALRRTMTRQFQRFLVMQVLLIIIVVILGIVIGLVLQRHERRRTRDMLRLEENESRFRSLFENSEVSIWNEDLSEVHKALEKLRLEGVTDLRQYLEDHPQMALDMVAMIKVLHVNRATLELFGVASKAGLLKNVAASFGKNAVDVFINGLCAIWNKHMHFQSEAFFRTFDGKEIITILSFQIPQTDDGFKSVPISVVDISERKRIENDMRASEQHLKLYREQAPLAAIEWNTDFQVAIRWMKSRVATLPILCCLKAPSPMLRR
jgi:PAS domain-containing protein